jgi:outer membrane immunogenic protein
MKKLSLATLGLAALVAAPAMAADLARPVYKAPPPPPPIFSWTGCYFGGNVGGAWVHKDITLTGPVFGGDSFSRSDSGVIGGLQGGCNYQFAGGWVVGIQGDYDWTNVNTSRNSILIPGLVESYNVRSVASVTGRVGYAWDRFLLYVKGGGAWERDDLTFAFPITAVTFGTTRSGWTIGVGGEYAFTNWITGFVEYDHYDFGTRTDNVVCGPVVCFVGAPVAGLPFDAKERKDVVKVGLNFLFGGLGGPGYGLGGPGYGPGGPGYGRY